MEERIAEQLWLALNDHLRRTRFFLPNETGTAMRELVFDAARRMVAEGRTSASDVEEAEVTVARFAGALTTHVGRQHGVIFTNSRGPQPIDIVSLQFTLRDLCPLWPICK